MKVNALVFPHVIILPILLINIISLKSRIRQVLLVLTPTDTLRFQKVDDCFVLLVDAREEIPDDPMGLSSNCGDIIRLTWMSPRMVICQSYALLRHPLEICCSCQSCCFGGGKGSYGLQLPYRSRYFPGICSQICRRSFLSQSLLD
jgi:hypothetical protein